MTDSVLNILKAALLALLYLFFARVLWAVWSEVKGPRVGNAPVQASAKAATGKPGRSIKAGKASKADRGRPPLPAPQAPVIPALPNATTVSDGTSPLAAPNLPAPASPEPFRRMPGAAIRTPAAAIQPPKGKPKPGRRGNVGRLVVIEPKIRKGTAIGLANEVTFGRSAGCTISVPDDNFVSQVHARVYTTGPDVIVEDLGSTNGTYVNGNRITGTVTLRPGDRIQFGTTVLWRPTDGAQLMANLRWGAATDAGRVRETNEDTFIAEPMIFGVADGMGGHRAGEVASAFAASILRDRLAHGAPDESFIAAVVTEANEAIFGAARANPEQTGMGTTLTALTIIPASNNADNSDNGDNSADQFALLNVGDSRTYRFRNGELARMTRDHSYVQELVNSGHITEDDARTHPRRNIVTRALGIDPIVSADITTVPIVRGDRFILCSDGLVDEVADADIAAEVRRLNDPQRLAEALVMLANRQGGRDNITVVVVDVLDGAPLTTNAPESAPVDHADAQADTNELQSALLAAAATADLDLEITEALPPPSGRPAAIIAPYKRRRLTVGSFLFVFAIAAIAVLTMVVLAAQARSGYFVGFDPTEQTGTSATDEVVVYKGHEGGFLWFDPTIEARTGTLRSELAKASITVVESNERFDSLDAARNFLKAQAPETTTTTTPPTTTTTTTVATSTTVADPTSTTIDGP